MATASNKNDLRALVHRLQVRVSSRNLDAPVVSRETASLAALGYKYDDKRYPRLGMETNPTTEIGESPSNLAEALLWKMGKWVSYNNFVASYANSERPATARNIVFSAFAKHLRNRETVPIYDQHALRAVFAICCLNLEEMKVCQSALVKRDGDWKASISGKDSTACYRTFTEQIAKLCSFKVECPVTLDNLDRLLMPLGQALKKGSPKFSEFKAACFGVKRRR